MFYLRSRIPVLFICYILLACNESGDQQEPGNATATNTTTIPATAPEGPNVATTTIYDIWVLDSIDGKAPDSNYFAHGSPYLDFNNEKKTISGFAGCNGINGKVNVNDQQLTFDSLAVSTQPCTGKGKEFEKKLVAGFKGGKTTYKIQNEMLYLNLSGSTFIFRKIRR